MTPPPQETPPTDTRTVDGVCPKCGHTPLSKAADGLVYCPQPPEGCGQYETRAGIPHRVTPPTERAEQIAWMQEARSSHVQWAEHLEAHARSGQSCAECDEKPFKMDPAHERMWVQRYDAVIASLTALTEAEARGEARGRTLQVDNGNVYIFCDHVDAKHGGCVRGAGHNGPHVFSPLSQPLGPVLLALQPPPEGGVPSQAPDVK